MTGPSNDPSIENEPHMQRGDYRGDPSEVNAKPPDAESDGQRIERSVWDEPALSPELAGTAHPADQTYAGWVQHKIDETDWFDSWATVLVVAAVGGVWGVIGALLNAEGAGLAGLLRVVVLAPIVEEPAKIAAAMVLVEKWPYLVRSRAQVVLCAVGAGLGFAAIENLIYIYVYAPGMAPSMVLWRWTVCVALHVTCTVLAGVGLARVWRRHWETLTRPVLSEMYPWLLAAAVVHGLYNFAAVMFEVVRQT